MRRILSFARTRRGQIGLGLVLVVVGVAVFGPLTAPYDPVAIVGVPGAPPGNGYTLGTDYLGHDLLSRLLNGGWSVLWLSVATTLLAYIAGVSIGLFAGYSRNFLDPILMRTVDVVLAFPPLLFFLIAATSVGTGEMTLVVGVAIVLAPGVARIVYTATREVSVRAYVEAAVARGERSISILRREVLPNIATPIITNFGLTLTVSILMVASVNFLNLGLQAPASNWALMISENRPILSLNVLSIIAPAVMLSMLTIGVNLIGDAISEALGRSGERIGSVLELAASETITVRTDSVK
ncbi:ABC transporter permease [Rhodococcus sp. NPDC060176]|uniref:ABC transporter permease n=1 Tax=Rhodococcus sp. NPDC060176 TaxID=3347062 RepID=UPI00364CA9B7